ncbi:hypothetical protein AAMO2058_000652400 [Amorphochlora amoebiformis]
MEDKGNRVAMERVDAIVDHSQTHHGAIGDWMRDYGDQAASRMPTQLRKAIIKESCLAKALRQCGLCCNYYGADNYEITCALEGLQLTLYELEYLKMMTSFTEPEIVLLAHQYQRLQEYGKGKVTSEELTLLPEFRRNPLKERLKEYFENRNGSKTFSVRQFITTLSIFSPRSSVADKCQFLYNVYDCDGDGKICRQDLKKILKMTCTRLNEKEISTVVDKTFEECSFNSSKSFISSKAPKKMRYIDYSVFSEVLAHTDVGSKVSIDLLGIARTHQLEKIGQVTSSMKSVARIERKNIQVGAIKIPGKLTEEWPSNPLCADVSKNSVGLKVDYKHGKLRRGSVDYDVDVKSMDKKRGMGSILKKRKSPKREVTFGNSMFF